MKDEIVTGQIACLDTGETNEIIPFISFRGDFELNTFVKIQHVESFLHQDNSRQICVDAMALDSCGFVFKISINFSPEGIGEEQEILSEITVGKILAARGYYSVLPDNKGGILLHDPIFSSLPPECSVTEVEEVFRVNNLANKNRLT